MFTSVKNAATRAKLNGEIVLLDREMAQRKRAFGVELYDLIAATSAKEKNNMLATPALFKAVESQIKGPLDTCRKDVNLLEGEKREKENELVVLEVRREKTEAKAAYSASEKMGKAGEWVSNASSQTKIEYRLTMIDRELKQRKEQFGLEIWDIVGAPSSIQDVLTTETKKGGLKAVTGALGGIGKGVASGISTNLGKMASKGEQEIQECLEKARREVASIDTRKKRKQREIEALS